MNLKNTNEINTNYDTLLKDVGLPHFLLSMYILLLAKEVRLSLNLTLVYSWRITCLQSLISFLLRLEYLVIVLNLSVTPFFMVVPILSVAS